MFSKFIKNGFNLNEYNRLLNKTIDLIYSSKGYRDLIEKKRRDKNKQHGIHLKIIKRIEKRETVEGIRERQEKDRLHRARWVKRKKGLLGLLLFIPGFIQAGTITRKFPDYYKIGQSTGITITIIPSTNTVAYILEDEVPLGINVSGINCNGIGDKGSWNPVSRKVQWGIYEDTSTRIFTYNMIPQVTSGTKTFNVQAGFTDSDYNIIYLNKGGDVLKAETFYSWRLLKFLQIELSNPGTQALGDFDGDGIVTLMEYAGAMNPKGSDANLAPSTFTSSGITVISYRRSKVAYDMSYDVYYATSSSGLWKTGNALVQQFSKSDNGTNYIIQTKAMNPGYLTLVIKNSTTPSYLTSYPYPVTSRNLVLPYPTPSPDDKFGAY